MSYRCTHTCWSVLVIASCVLSGCAGVSRSAQRSGDEDDVSELAVRRVLAHPALVPPEMVDRVGICLMRGPSYEAGRVAAPLLRRFERDARRFTTADALPECWENARRSPDEDVRVAPVFLESVHWDGRDAATVETSFACGHHGCARGSFALMRGPKGWRVLTESFCNEDPYSAAAAKMERCPDS
jgi:hypothetical protein